MIFILCTVISGCFMENTKKELVASKCRLHVPVRAADCEAAGVHGVLGGQIKGLPVSEMTTGKTTQEVMLIDTESHIQFLEGSKYQKDIEDFARSL